MGLNFALVSFCSLQEGVLQRQIRKDEPCVWFHVVSCIWIQESYVNFKRDTLESW
jgi:hypothetical protein